MKIEHSHNFDKDEALARVKALTTYWDTKYGTRTTWQGDAAQIKGKVKGISFDGKFTVDERRLVGEVKVGFLAEKLGGRGYVEHKLAQYLDPGTTLEALQARR